MFNFCPARIKRLFVIQARVRLVPFFRRLAHRAFSSCMPGGKAAILPLPAGSVSSVFSAGKVKGIMIEVSSSDSEVCSVDTGGGRIHDDGCNHRRAAALVGSRATVAEQVSHPLSRFAKREAGSGIRDDVS